MPTFQVRIGEYSYIVVAGGIVVAMGVALEEDERGEGVAGVIESAKRIKDRVIGVAEDEAQRTLWAAKES